MVKLIESQNSGLSSHPFENSDEYYELRKYCTVLKRLCNVSQLLTQYMYMLGFSPIFCQNHLSVCFDL